MKQSSFLQNHIVTTCTGVFISVKLVQVLPRSSSRTLHSLNHSDVPNVVMIACLQAVLTKSELLYMYNGMIISLELYFIWFAYSFSAVSFV